MLSSVSVVWYGSFEGACCNFTIFKRRYLCMPHSGEACWAAPHTIQFCVNVAKLWYEGWVACQESKSLYCYSLISVYTLYMHFWPIKARKRVEIPWGLRAASGPIKGQLSRGMSKQPASGPPCGGPPAG